MVYYFLEGGAFMWPILLTLLFGLAFVIERAYSLMMSAVDSQTFFESVSQSIKENGTDAAVQVCSETEGPVASIFHAGLSKMSRGLDEVEKAIQNAGISSKDIDLEITDGKYEFIKNFKIFKIF